MESYQDFIKRISSFEKQELPLGIDAFVPNSAMRDKVKPDNSFRPFYGDTVVFDMLGNLARYTFQSERWFEPGQYFGSSKSPQSINLGNPDSKITSLLIINDIEIATRQTIYGELAFLQLVGITTDELNR